ncbi:hypothetical protein ACQP3J_32060, partial [Escherichia coli]
WRILSNQEKQTSLLALYKSISAGTTSSYLLNRVSVETSATALVQHKYNNGNINRVATMQSTFL